MLGVVNPPGNREDTILESGQRNAHLLLIYKCATYQVIIEHFEQQIMGVFVSNLYAFVHYGPEYTDVRCEE